MEFETAVRSKLPLIVFVINNNGIYHGLDAETYRLAKVLPSTALSPDIRYEMIAEVKATIKASDPYNRLVEVKDTW